MSGGQLAHMILTSVLINDEVSVVSLPRHAFQHQQSHYTAPQSAAQIIICTNHFIYFVKDCLYVKLKVSSNQTRRALGRARSSTTQFLIHENISGSIHF